MQGRSMKNRGSERNRAKVTQFRFAQAQKKKERTNKAENHSEPFRPNRWIPSGTEEEGVNRDDEKRSR